MIPENGANVLRQELAASVLSARTSSGQELAASVLSTLPAARDLPAISAPRWRKWLRAAPFGDRDVRSTEDPACNPFTETVVFFGGSYTVLPGTYERSANILQMLLRAVFLGDQSSAPLSSEFAQSARGLALAALTLSDKCATNAGLGRDERANTLPTDEIVHPHGERLARLRDAVTFSSAEIDTHLARLGLGVEVLSLLAMDAGVTNASEISMDELPVYRKPILRIDGNYVLGASTAPRTKVA